MLFFYTLIFCSALGCLEVGFVESKKKNSGIYQWLLRCQRRGILRSDVLFRDWAKLKKLLQTFFGPNLPIRTKQEPETSQVNNPDKNCGTCPDKNLKSQIMPLGVFSGVLQLYTLHFNSLHIPANWAEKIVPEKRAGLVTGRLANSAPNPRFCAVYTAISCLEDLNRFLICNYLCIWC